MNDTIKLIGKLVEGDPNRDAIHMAVAPVVAARTLSEGKHVGLDENGNATDAAVTLIGIVDPFLKKIVRKGERFWLFLYPGTITSLHHVWEHPAFKTPNTSDNRAASVAWLKNYAVKVRPYDADSPDLAYSNFMNAIESGEHSSYGDSIYRGDEPSELWTHLAIVLGRPINPENISFTCSC